RFALVAGRWPAIHANLLGRAVRRSHWLALRLTINNLTGVDVRLLVLFWHLADRGGKVTVDGVVLHLGLTHELLAKLVGAQRPSVTTALGQLRDRGLLEKRPDGSWLLSGEPPEALRLLDSRFADPL